MLQSLLTPTASENVFGKINRLGVNTVCENQRRACEGLDCMKNGK